MQDNQSVKNTTTYPNVAEGSALRASDLQIAKYSSGFDMEHKMGLIGVTLADRDVYDVLYYDGNTYNASNTPKWTVNTTKSSATKVTWGGSTSFSGTYTPYVSNKVCYQVVKPNVTAPSYTASIDNTNKKYAWSQTCTAVTSANSYMNYSIDYDVDAITACWEFSYTNPGTGKQWVAPKDGTYTMECWGAQGGGTTAVPGGKGAYTIGEITLSKDDNLYVYVGHMGDVNDSGATNNTTVSVKNYTWDANIGAYSAIFNNGFATMAINGAWCFAGGGSTDIRTTGGNWNNSTSIDSRIMVAAGGGGTNTYSSTKAGGAAGAYTGYSGLINGSDGVAATGGTQSRGGAHGTGGWVVPTTYYTLTKTAYAAKGQTMWYNVCCSGGGGGLYCGGNGAHGNETTGSGAGGSSYISGQSGCTTITGYSFSGSYMIDGAGVKYTSTSSSTSSTNIPAHDGFTAGLGHTGNGYARITYTP